MRSVVTRRAPEGLEISGELIFEAVTRHARERPDERAVLEVDGDGLDHELNWSELADQSRRWAHRLLELGVKPGEPVAYQLPNRLEFVSISLGALTIGAVCEPLMPIFREHELEFMLRRSAARVLIVPHKFRGHDHAAMAMGLRDRLETLEHVVVLEEGSGVRGVREPGVAREEVRADDRGNGAALTARRPTADMTAQLLFTSGSTGEPKGVLQNHRSLNLAAQMHVRHFGLTREDVIYAPSPLAHQTGFLYGMWIALMLGAPLVIQGSWSAELGFDAVRRAGVTFVQAATPFLADVVRIAKARGERAGRLRTFVATGAAIPRELAREARDVLGAEVGGAFGTTESCLGAAFVPGEHDERAWGTDGRALHGLTLRIVDDQGHELPAGTEGNFEVLTPTLFEGYLDRPDLTAEAITADGYYRTGDLATIDADGYLRITGRVKDVINRGGEKVPVVEVEQLLYSHPAVEEVAIVAMPDPRLGERACAFIVLAPGGELDFESMQRHLQESRISKPYWPERLEIVDSLPRTPSGKIQKFVLRDRVSSSVGK
jgi:3-phosphoshikimate 1-carboxyvinyltransferase